MTSILLAQRRWIGLVGGVAIMLLGLRAVLKQASASRPAEAVAERGARGALGAYGSTLALTLSNPPTILSFAAVFAGFGVRVGSGWPAALALVIGVLLGSATWWVLIVSVASVARERLSPGLLRGIGLGSGLFLAAFGVAIVVQSLVNS